MGTLYPVFLLSLFLRHLLPPSFLSFLPSLCPLLSPSFSLCLSVSLSPCFFLFLTYFFILTGIRVHYVRPIPFKISHVFFDNLDHLLNRSKVLSRNRMFSDNIKTCDCYLFGLYFTSIKVSVTVALFNLSLFTDVTFDVLWHITLILSRFIFFSVRYKYLNFWVI